MKTRQRLVHAVRRMRVLVPALGLLLAIPALAMIAPTTIADHPPQVPCLVLACPDIVVDGSRFDPFIQVRTFSPTNCNVVEGMSQPGTRTLLRFTFTTPNVGAGDLVIGNAAINPLWFEFGTCHGHQHFKEYADYRLWTPEQFAAWDALRVANPDLQAHVVLEQHPELQPVRGDKRGFCVIDILPYDEAAIPKFVSCDLQGISVGWADEYHWALDGQFIDVTGVPSGTYVLEAEVNAERFYMESDHTNNRAWEQVRI